MGCACKCIVTVDYDDAPEEVVEYFKRRAEKLGACAHYCKPSSSGRGWHCTFCFPWDCGEEEALAYQAALGDDPLRVLLCLRRLIMTGRRYDILFIEKRVYHKLHGL